MAYITLDFGSSNSGALLNTACGKTYCSSDLIFIHEQEGDTGFTKQPTVFWIKKSLLNNPSFTENDVDVYSCVFYDEEVYAEKANFIWCKKQIEKALPKLTGSDEWVRIQHPKMALYANDKHPSQAKIKASNGSEYPLAQILRIFFTVIKKECLKKASDAQFILSPDDIIWAITVPGLAIWNQDAVQVIRDIATPIFGEKVSFLSEPECALIGINIAGRDSLDFKADRLSLVVDLGGGTADICVMKESSHSDGTMTFDEIKSTREGQDSTTSKKAGGNDIERNFISFFMEYLMNGVEYFNSPAGIYEQFLRDQPVGSIEFQKQMIDLLFHSDKIKEDIINFNPERIFNQWLQLNYPDAAKKRDAFAAFSLNGAEVRKHVIYPIHDIILSAVEENLRILKDKGMELDLIYFAGGLSLDQLLKKNIKDLSSKYFPYIQFKETANKSVVGAIQRGGNHLIVNQDTLVRRMSRRNFYVRFLTKYSGNQNELRNNLSLYMRDNYNRLTNHRLNDVELKEIIDKQWHNMQIYHYPQGDFVAYYSPLCVKFAPVNKPQEYSTYPINEGDQTGVNIRVFSSDDTFVLFNNQELRYEGVISYDFGYNWSEAKIVFDPVSNAVDGTALFYLTDKDGNKLKEIVINNVSKRGI